MTDSQRIDTDLFAHIPTTFPPEDFKTIFAETSSGVYLSGTIVRIYFARADGDIYGRPVNPPHITPAGQVMLPPEGFVGLALFLEAYLKDFVAGGHFPQEKVDEMRKAFPQLTKTDE